MDIVKVRFVGVERASTRRPRACLPRPTGLARATTSNGRAFVTICRGTNNHWKYLDYYSRQLNTFDEARSTIMPGMSTCIVMCIGEQRVMYNVLMNC